MPSSSLLIQAIGHFSFTVSDVERAADWYSSHLGFDVVHRQRQDNAYTRQLVGIADAILDVAVLRHRASTDLVLELVEYVRPRSRGRAPIPGRAGFAHLSFLVDHIQADHRRLRDAGVRFRSPPVEITAGVNAGGFVCYFVDPDGNGLELFQPPRLVRNDQQDGDSGVSNPSSTRSG